MTPTPRKPKAIKPGACFKIISPASPADSKKTQAGIVELQRLGFSVQPGKARPPEGYFADAAAARCSEFLSAIADPSVQAIVALRGGYGSTYLLDGLSAVPLAFPKFLIGYSDITSLHIFLWQRLGWVSFYGPMVAAGLDAGAGRVGGYDEESFRHALCDTQSGWSLELQGEPINGGETQGLLVGGCLTTLEGTLGTPWELNTDGAILILEDRAMKPFLVDRSLMHLKQAGKLAGVRGIVLGDFPECEPPVAGSPTVVDVCRRILAPLGVPIVWGVPIGHTKRPMLTLPLGVEARLRAQSGGTLEILEPAVVA